MQKEKFQEYLHNPESYKNAELSELEELSSEFPWFSSASIILLHSSNIQEDPNFNLLLKKHSINIPNRKILHKLLRYIPVNQVNKSDFVTEETLVPEPHSRIPGIFDTDETIYSPIHIQSESHISSVLDDDSLLDFSYSGRKSNIGNSENIENQFTGTEEIQDFKAGEVENSKLSEDTGSENFDHWISKMSRESDIEESPLKKYEIIESFMNSDPGVIRADKETRLSGDISKGSAEENEGFITDTLAKIYLKQGLYNKAIYAYEKLSLKYPEKSIYFVTQIEEIKSLYIKK